MLYAFIFLQNEEIEIDNLPCSEILNETDKIIRDVNLDDTSSVIRNWSSLMNDDLDTLIPEYDCVSTSKAKEPTESEVQLELEGILFDYIPI